jgi:hypothetical protein
MRQESLAAISYLRARILPLVTGSFDLSPLDRVLSPQPMSAAAKQYGCHANMSS